MVDGTVAAFGKLDMMLPWMADGSTELERSASAPSVQRGEGFGEEVDKDADLRR
jgi:hypothetical protein